MINITKNINEANFITHSGSFHPDDVFSTMFLTKINPDRKVCRVTKVPEQLNKDVIVYDIGFGKFDHHGPDALWRNEKIKYCSFGLLWKEFGYEYLKSITPDYEELYKVIDEKLVMQIDGIDNGLFPKIEAEYKITDLDNVIDFFNKAWDENVDNDDNFVLACETAKVIFERIMIKEQAKIKATKLVKEAIEKNEREDILFLNEYMPFNDALYDEDNEKAKKIKIVIFPSNRGGYNIKPRTISKENKDLLVKFDEKLCGLHDEELASASGIKTARFIHSSGFLAAADDLEGAILLAENALKNEK